MKLPISALSQFIAKLGVPRAALGLALALSIVQPCAASDATAARELQPASVSQPLHESAVAVQDFDWQDPARQRAVPVRLYWPQAAAGEDGKPAAVGLVVFSHGIGGSRRGYSYLGRYLAANGIASLHVQHVGSDRELWFGNPFALVDRLHTAARDDEAIARVRDLRFALDQVLASPYAASIDTRHIVVAGHSYGANTALLAAGARVERGGRELDFRDPRFSGAVLISAPPFYGEVDPAKVLKHVEIPTLHITATEDLIVIPGYRSGAEDRVKLFEAIGGQHKALAMFEGGSHSIFTDRSVTGGLLLNPKVKTATSELELAFIRRLFGGNTDKIAMQHWGERWKGILSKYVSVDVPALNDVQLLSNAAQ